MAKNPKKKTETTETINTPETTPRSLQVWQELLEQQELQPWQWQAIDYEILRVVKRQVRKYTRMNEVYGKPNLQNQGES